MTFQRPIIKPTLPVYRVTTHLFRIGAQLGLTSQFNDPKQQMWDLVSLLDGKPLDAVISAMLVKHSSLTEGDILEGLELLDRLGFVDDYVEDSTEQRYRANVEYFASIPGNRRQDAVLAHEKLRNSHALVLGMGGGGSNIACLLSGTGIGRITIVDGDVVEESNLGRQFLYAESDIGRSKVDVAFEKLSAMNSDLQVNPINAFINSSADVAPLLDSVDVVICALDEPPFVAQRRVNAAIVKSNVPCVFGATQLTHGRVFTVVPNVTGCFDCLHVYYSRNDERFVPQFRGFMEAKFEPPTIAYGPTIWNVALVMVDEAVRNLTGYAKCRSLGRQYELDYLEYSSFPHPDWPKYEDCPTCGSGAYSDWPIFKYCSDGVG